MAQQQDIVFVDKSFDADRSMAGIGVLWTTQDKSRTSSSIVKRCPNDRRADLEAVLEAIKHADPNSNVLIHTDSDYVLKVLKSEFNDTDNVDLIQEIQQYSTREKDIQIALCSKENENIRVAHRLAFEALRTARAA